MNRQQSAFKRDRKIMTTSFIAHVKQDENGEWQIHSLEEHLREVGRIAGEMAGCFGAQDWARLAGLWHDLGKYKPAFQSYIGAASGYKADGHLEMPGKEEREHSTAGAIHAVRRHSGVGRVLAYLIAGHHAGLPDWFKDAAEGRGLSDRLKDVFHLESIEQRNIPASIWDADLPKNQPTGSGEYAHLWIRMLFSCLVDADFLDTEKFMERAKADLRSIDSDIDAHVGVLTELECKLTKWTKQRDDELKAKGNWDTSVNTVRREVLQDALDGADKSPGFFSFTVPTGGGKTLSAMAFSLAHCRLYKKRRVIVAIPFTSIIEQTAKQYKEIFGEDAVIEHHSNLDPDRETPQGRLAAENWDAPIIVTTNVQLFESLFAAKTSRCRKLHNIVNSVIVLDEAQMLPPEKLMPLLSVLKGLVSQFNCSIVLCTATQPALTGRFDSGDEGCWEGLRQRGISPNQDSRGVLEIVRNSLDLSKKLRRIELHLHKKENLEWSDLAKELATFEQVLCIVNRRQDCRDVYEALLAETKQAAVHLSALMCGEHRSQVISDIKTNLKQGLPMRVVSTQLVEAGVDIDFPVVYRAMAGLDSIAQAAGRCNREGKLNAEGRLGQVFVFHPPKPSPPGLLRKGEDVCAELLRTIPDQVRKLSPLAFEQYFRLFFGAVNSHGKKEYEHFLITNAGFCQFQFRSAADWFRLIDDNEYKSVIVWYERKIDKKTIGSKKVINEIEILGPSRERLRQLSRYTVSIPLRVHQGLVAQGVIRELETPQGPTGFWVQAVDRLYDPVFGLRLEGPQYETSDFIC
jgi:CRISPR-associated endonuclease/helicase Cas3